jgi:Arc/MetJ-type ribon-helix-helix transcriptional regulator
MKNEYGFINDGKVYLNAFLDFPEREIGKVLLTDEKAFEYFDNRFSLLTVKVEQLEQGMQESRNKGSFLMKIIHLKKSLGTFNALGDFTMLFRKLNILQQELEGDVQNNRLRNLELKEDLLNKTKTLVERKSYENDEEVIKEVHQNWLRIGRVTEEKEQILETTFKALVDQFFEEKREERIRQDRLVYGRLEKYSELLEEGKRLFYLRKYVENKNSFMKLQQEWKRVGSVPRDKFFKISKDFQKLGNSFFDKLNEEANYMKERSTTELSGLEIKRAINVRSRAVFELPSEEGFQLVKILQHEWKESGFVPKKMDASIFNEFYKNCEYAYEYRYFTEACHKRLGANSSSLQKTGIMESMIMDTKKEIAEFEKDLEKYRNRRDDESRKFASKLMVKRRKLEVKELILKGLF